MKRVVPFVVSLLLGLCVGWWLGYTRPVVKNQRQLLREYQYVRDNFHMTDAEMAEAGPKIPQYFEDMKRQDEIAAVFALGTFKILEQGDTERAKSHLLKAVGAYYRVYRGNGDTNFIAKVEEAARKYPAVAAEIARKIE